MVELKGCISVWLFGLKKPEAQTDVWEMVISSRAVLFISLTMN